MTGRRKMVLCVLLAAVCIVARLVVGAFSLNYVDFKNFLVTGELAAAGRNVYAEQPFYNYGPAFFILLGWLYRAASLFPNIVLAFKLMLVAVLTASDLLIARLIAKKAGTIWGMVFFLNPISFITCSYLCQFDGIAVLFAAYGISFIEASSRNDRFAADVLLGTLFLSLSLITKHIMWAFPLWLLLNTKIDNRRKLLYAFVPVVLFLLSFVPYWSTGQQGIINNVFLYRSRNNFPLFGLDIVYRLINHLPVFARYVIEPYGMAVLPFSKYMFTVYGMLMLAGAYVFRHETVCKSFLLYVIAVVCFSSAISTQYFSIPCMALVILFRKKSLLYFPLIGLALFGKHIMKIVMVWVLLWYLIDYYRHIVYRT